MEDDNDLYNIKRFEEMLRTKGVYFFDADEFEDIILYYFDEGKMSLCKKALQLALEQHPDSVDIKLLEVEVLIFEEKFSKALEVLDYVDQLEPQHEEVYFFKAEIYSKQGNHKKSIAVLLELLEFYDDLADVYKHIGGEYLYLENPKKALHYYQKCLEIDKQNTSVLFNIVNCYNELQKYTEAITYLRSVIQSNPYFIYAWLELGSEYLYLKDYKEAIEAFDMAIAINDGYSSSYFKKAFALEQLGEYEQAITCYEEVARLVDDEGFVDYAIANCYASMGEHFAQAEEYYLQSIKKDPSADEAWVGLTDLYINEGAYAQAQQIVKKALDLDEENPVFWKLKSMVFFHLNDFQTAETAIAKAVKYDKYDLDAWLKWIDINYVSEELERTEYLVQEALSVFHMEPTLLYRIAGVQLLMGNDKGIVSLKKALTIAPDLLDVFKELFPMLIKHPLVQIVLKS